MGREVKTISLDSMTAKLAEDIPNFSQWVRQQLIMEHIAQGGESLHTVREEDRKFSLRVPTNEKDSFGRRKVEFIELNMCNPYHKKGTCQTCWPPVLSVEGHIAKIMKESIE